LFAMGSYRVFFGLEKTIEPTSLARIKGSSRKAGSILDVGSKSEEFPEDTLRHSTQLSFFAAHRLF
jgi:hypothetical protein